MIKNSILLALFGILIFLIISNISAQQSVSVCCEKIKTGAWCQNTNENNCNTGFRVSPTSCDQTSYCKPGCCVDPDEGLCMENTPQKVCEESSGNWFDDNQCNINQCSLGCCVLGDQASFVTLTRCKKLSAEFGLETDFRTDVADEVSCILIANSQDKGACVIDNNGQKDCKLVTRGECTKINEEAEFFKDFLCSADELATICGPTQDTICVPGKQEVYFKDSCGNPANIYDANKVYSKNPAYWQKIVPKEQSCGFNRDDGNKKSASCGNCEYFKGSICAQGQATYGDFFCKDLNCYNTKNGQDYKNGESWCVYQNINDKYAKNPENNSAAVKGIIKVL